MPSLITLLDSQSCPIAVVGASPDRIWAIVLGVFLAFVAIALLVASWTKWGQTKSLTKCIILAFLAHVWLLMYAYGTRIVTPGIGGGSGGGVRQSVEYYVTADAMPMSELDAPVDSSAMDQNAEPGDLENTSNDQNVDDSNGLARDASAELKPWDSPLETPNLLQADAPEPMPVAPAPIASVPSPMPAETAAPSSTLPPDLSVADLMDLARSDREPEILPDQPIAIQSPIPTINTPNQISSAPMVPVMQSPARISVAEAASAKRRVDQPQPSIAYQLRMSAYREQFAFQNGGDENSEASVQRALAWLARNQSPDGSWNAAAHGAGQDIHTQPTPDGEFRHNAGQKANTAMTGLALLSFLGAGHTHLEGPYAETITRGLRYLLAQQFPSGDLSGREQVGREPTVRFARMYSHGMASLALTEAFALTGDRNLQPAIQAAAKYTLAAMNPQSGGWRYEFPTDDPGDTSQFGWQAMLLNSAHNNGVIVLQPSTRNAMQRFLDSVAAGRSGGLAVYRRLPGQITTSRDGATAAMTAEALASRLLLGFPVTPAAAEEGQQMLLSNLPGHGEENLYYWYYASIAMYQLRGDGTASDPALETNWNRWNDALKRQLCGTQVVGGNEDGSWNPSCVWGGYGGRVYSTSLACMSLEVYYRYLPMYKANQFAAQWQPASPRR